MALRSTKQLPLTLAGRTPEAWRRPAPEIACGRVSMAGQRTALADGGGAQARRLRHAPEANG
eukprot:354903-Chlamydomonas_euryale.AAC.8